jgi:hypothetical protein
MLSHRFELGVRDPAAVVHPPQVVDPRLGRPIPGLLGYCARDLGWLHGSFDVLK